MGLPKYLENEMTEEEKREFEEFMNKPDLPIGSFVVIAWRDDEYNQYLVEEFDSKEVGEALQYYDARDSAALLVVIMRKGENDIPSL